MGFLVLRIAATSEDLVLPGAEQIQLGAEGLDERASRPECGEAMRESRVGDSRTRDESAARDELGIDAVDAVANPEPPAVAGKARVPERRVPFAFALIGKALGPLDACIVDLSEDDTRVGIGDAIPLVTDH